MTIQSDVYTIIFITLLLSIGIIVIGKRIEKLDPLKKPTGICAVVILGVQAVSNTCISNTGKSIARKLAPYIIVLWTYIFCSNTCSLFGLSSPTSNLSVTLMLAFLTWLLIQIVELKYGGFKSYMHAFIEPIAPMLPMNIIGKFSTMISMSLRLFGNIICGSIMMQLVYSGAQILSNTIVGIFVKGLEGNVFNFMAPVIAPLLHAYFDVFAGFIQTLVFVTLTVVLIGNDVPDEEKAK